jgi:FixJ family two-component response regulator
MWSHDELGKTMPDSHKVIAVVDDDPEMRALRWQACCRHMDTARKPSIQLRHFSPALQRARQPVWSWIFSLATFQVWNWLTNSPRMASLYPIIFMTGLDDEVIRTQAAAAGGVAFLHKPFPAQTLFDAIKKASG